MPGQSQEHSLNHPLIIVGYGYLGQKIANMINDSNKPDIYAISRQVHKNPPNVQSIKLDLDDKEQLKQKLPCTNILYLAPPPKTGQIDSRMNNFLNLLSLQSLQPKKMVLISTTGVYGNCQGAWINETAPLQPKADRAMRRADAESKFSQYAKQSNIAYTILRVAGIYAEDKLPLARIRSAQPLVAKDESPYTNRIHAEDLARICIQALNEKHPGIYNCADGNPSTMYEYFSGLAEAFELPQPPAISLKEAQQELSPGMLSYMRESRRIDNSKLLKEFKVNLKYPSFDTFLEKLKAR